MSVTSLNFSSLNLLNKGPALVHQHFMDLHVATVLLKFVQLKLDLIEKSGLGPLGAARSKKYRLPILVTICHTLGGVHSKCTGSRPQSNILKKLPKMLLEYSQNFYLLCFLSFPLCLCYASI